MFRQLSDWQHDHSLMSWHLDIFSFITFPSGPTQCYDRSTLKYYCLCYILLHLPRINQSLKPCTWSFIGVTPQCTTDIIIFQQMSSSMNNWRKLKIELVPEAERAFVLICQGLFKISALAGFSVLLANKYEILAGMLKTASKFCYKHHENTAQGQWGLCLSYWLIKIPSCFLFLCWFWSLRENNSW